MPRMLRTFRLLLAGPLLIGLGVFSAWPEVFECRDARGNKLYQDSPCPRKPSQRSTTPARTPDSHRNESETLTKIKARASQAAGRGAQRDKAVPRRESLVTETEKQVRPVDSRFSSPERTWQTFLRALEGANRDLAVSCLTSSARSTHESPLRAQPREKLWKLADEFSVLEFKEDFGPYKVAVAPITGGGEHRIYFQRLANGEWKITALHVFSPA